MADNKIKKGFGSIKRNRENPKEKIVKTPIQKAVKTIIKPEVKQGRPTDKDPTISYVKIGALVPEKTKDMMKIALLTNFKGVHKTQEEFIGAAIIHYIKSRKTQ